MPTLSLRSRFTLQRTSDILNRVQSVATALAFVGGRLTPIAALGIAAHLIAFGVSLVNSDLQTVAATWHEIPLANDLHRAVREVLLRQLVQRDKAWFHCEVGGQSVLVNMDDDHARGSFYAERDPQAVLDWVKSELWRTLEQRATVVPVGPWGDSIALTPAQPGTDFDSRRAREVWSRIEPMVRAGVPRSVLLDGPPRTGKSTIARRLILLAEEALGRRLTVLRIAVSDFQYIRASMLDSVVAFLKPDVLVIDDIDRFGACSSLLDLFEHVRQYCRLVITTSNDPSQMPLALRLPGRIDEALEVLGAGPELAAHVLGALWCRLTEEQRTIVEGWPVALIEELRVRLTHRVDAVAAEEVASLEKRMQESRSGKEAKAKPEEKAVAVSAATAS